MAHFYRFIEVDGSSTSEDHTGESDIPLRMPISTRPRVSPGSHLGKLSIKRLQIAPNHSRLSTVHDVVSSKSEEKEQSGFICQDSSSQRLKPHPSKQQQNEEHLACFCCEVDDQKSSLVCAPPIFQPIKTLEGLLSSRSMNPKTAALWGAARRTDHLPASNLSLQFAAVLRLGPSERASTKKLSSGDSGLQLPEQPRKPSYVFKIDSHITTPSAARGAQGLNLQASQQNDSLDRGIDTNIDYALLLMNDKSLRDFIDKRKSPCPTPSLHSSRLFAKAGVQGHS